MEKTYKVITSNGLGEIYIEHFNTLEAAMAACKKACEDECEFSYLLETEVNFTSSGDSVNKIISKHTANHEPNQHK